LRYAIFFDIIAHRIKKIKQREFEGGYGMFFLVVGIIAVVAGAIVLISSKHAQLQSAGVTKAVGLVIIVVGVIVGFLSCIRTVDASHTGVVKEFGSLKQTTLSEGMHVTVPWAEVIEIDNRTQKQSLELSCFSSDIQEVQIIYTVNFLVPSVESRKIYAQYGEDYYNVIITPAIQQIVKEYTAKYTAENLVSSRSELSEQIITALTAQLENYGIELVNASIENIDFTEEFTAAVEAKQVAEQKKLQAQTEAEQKLIEAQAEADALLIEAQAQADANALLEASLTEMILRKAMIDKWDGVLPLVTGEDGMMIDISSLTGDTTTN